jgi:hypothetical protein
MERQLELMMNELVKKTSDDIMVETMAALFEVVTSRQTKALEIMVKKLKNTYYTEVIITNKKDYETIINMLELQGKTWNDGFAMDSLDPYCQIEADEYLVLCIHKSGVGYYGTKEQTDQLTILEYVKL